MIEESVVNVIGPIVTGNIHGQVLPQGPTYPAIRYTADATPDATMTGESNLSNHLLQIDVYAETYAEMFSLKNQVRDLMREDFPFQNICTLDADGFEPEGRIFRRTMTFSVWEEQ